MGRVKKKLNNYASYKRKRTPQLRTLQYSDLQDGRQKFLEQIVRQLKSEVRIVLEKCDKYESTCRLSPNRSEGMYQERSQKSHVNKKIFSAYNNSSDTIIECPPIEQMSSVFKEEVSNESNSEYTFNTIVPVPEKIYDKDKLQIHNVTIAGSCQLFNNEHILSNKINIDDDLVGDERLDKKNIGIKPSGVELNNNFCKCVELTESTKSCSIVSSFEECILKEKCHLANNPHVIDFVKTAVSTDSWQESNSVHKEANDKSVSNFLRRDDMKVVNTSCEIELVTNTDINPLISLDTLKLKNNNTDIRNHEREVDMHIEADKLNFNQEETIDIISEVSQEQNINLEAKNKNICSENTLIDTVHKITNADTCFISNKRIESTASEIQTVTLENENSLSDKMKNVCINTSDFSRKLTFEAVTCMEHSSHQRKLIESKMDKNPNLNCSTTISDHTSLIVEKVLEDKLNASKCDLNKNSVIQASLDNENKGISQYSKLASHQMKSEDLNPISRTRYSLQNIDSTSDNASMLSPSNILTDNLAYCMNILHISTDAHTVDKNQSSVIVGNSNSNLQFPIKMSSHQQHENISQVNSKAPEYNEDITSLYVKQDIFHLFENSQMQISTNQKDLLQSFESEYNEELLSMTKEDMHNIATLDCLKEIDTFISDFDGTLPAQSMEQIQEAETIDEVDDCLSLFAVNSERESLDWETFSESSAISELLEGNTGACFSKANKFIQKNNTENAKSTIRGQGRKVKITKENFNKEVKYIATEDMEIKANEHTHKYMKETSDDGDNCKAINVACEAGTKCIKDQNCGNVITYLENGSKTISTAFKNICFQHLRKGFCLQNYCKYLHEIPDILKLNDFEEVLQFAKENNFLYFIRKCCEILMNEAWMNYRQGMWKKVFILSDICGLSADQFTIQLSDIILSSPFKKDTLSFSELLMLLMDNGLFNDCLGGIKMFSNLDHNLLSCELLSRLMDEINSRMCGATLCKELYNDLFVHIPASQLEKIMSFDIERLASSLEYFGLNEEAQYFRCKFDIVSSNNEKCSHHHIDVDEVQNSVTTTQSENLNVSRSSQIGQKGDRPKYLELTHNQLKELSEKKYRASGFQSNFHKRQNTSQNLQNVYVGRRTGVFCKNLRSLNQSKQFQRQKISNYGASKGINKNIDENCLLAFSTNYSSKKQDRTMKIHDKKLCKLSRKSCVECTLDIDCNYANIRNTKPCFINAVQRQTLLKRKYQPWMSSDLRYTVNEKRAKINVSVNNPEESTKRCEFQHNPCMMTTTHGQEIFSSLIKPEYVLDKNVNVTHNSQHLNRTDSHIKMRQHTNSIACDQIASQYSKVRDSMYLLKSGRTCVNQRNCDPVGEFQMLSVTRHKFPNNTIYRTVMSRDWRTILEICRQLKGNSGSETYAWQVYSTFRLNLQKSATWFSYLVEETGIDVGLPLYVEKFLSTVGTNLMLDLIDQQYWERAYVVFCKMREARIDIRFSKVYRDEIFSACRKILICVVVCCQVGTTEEALALLEYNRMLSPKVNEWKLENIGQDFKLWLWTCTTLLNTLLINGPLELAQYFFLELLKGQDNLYAVIDLNQFCNVLMVKLLNGNHILEAVELYYYIKPHFHILAFDTYRALLVILVSQNYKEMAQGLFEASVLTSIYSNIELKQPLLHITLHSYLLHEEIYIILKNFFHHILKRTYWNLQVNPDPIQYKVVIFIKPGDPFRAKSLKNIPSLLIVECSLSAAQKRISDILYKYFPQIKYYVDERWLDIILDPCSVINYLQSNLYFQLTH